MNLLTRKRALRAAAKVALSFTVMGCGTVVIEDDALPTQDDPQEIEQLDPGVTVSVKLPASTAEELMCQAPPLGQEVVVDDELLGCCSDALDALMPQDPNDWDALTALQSNADAQACCAVLIVNHDNDISGGEFGDWEALQACCVVADWPIGPTCTPWGPPVPPAMLRRFDSLDELAAEQLREVA